jgi:formamidopyrimidine-DNA glycosylase
MPELPEVETVRRGLASYLEGRSLARVDVRRGDLRIPVPEDFAERITNRRVERLWRRGKYLLMDLNDGATIAGPGELKNHPLLTEMGPEPLDPAFDGATLSVALRTRNISIKAALLDQRVVAGIGNIYACEALFRAGISPRRKAKGVAGRRAERLVPALKHILAEAIEAGGSSLRDHRRPDGELGYFQHSFTVYGREGELCPGCDCNGDETGGIQRMVQGGRSTFFCPRRQQ